MKTYLYTVVSLVLTGLIALPTNSWATGEASTYFQIFAPANNQNWNRDVSIIVTAIYDNTTFQIIDDGMDGDTDDSVTGTLNAGQSYVLFIKDNGVNDDAGSNAKQDGDYFIITSSNLVLASMSTNSDWQHDWVPATNKTSKGQRFFVYSPPTSNSKRDLNVYAFEDSTEVTIKVISTALTTTTGYTSVDASLDSVVVQKTLNIGEDLIFFNQDGRNIMETGGTYLVESNKPITVQYGALWQNARDGGGYVPSDNGSSSGELFYFTVHTQANREQEVRIVSWDDANVVSLDYYQNGNWINMDSWTLDELEPGDWLSKTHGNNIDKVFRVTCSAGKRVSVFEANWLETGSPGTSDIASMVSAKDGTSAGEEFLVYMAPPGTENNVTDPFTGTKFDKGSHIYIFAKDSANVTVKDANTNGTVINRTYNIAPGRYVDCFLTLNEWKSIYNGNGNPDSGPERPYLIVTSDAPISALNTNFNDNWMAYFGTSKTQDFSIGGRVMNPSLDLVGDCFDISDTAQIQNQIFFNNTTNDLVNPVVQVVVPDGAVVLNSILKNDITQEEYVGVISIDENTGETTVNFPTAPNFSPLYTYTVESQVVLAINHYDGTLITNRTLISVETIVTGMFDGELQQATSSNGVLICSDISLPENIVTPQANTWSVAWGDYDNDCDPDLFIANYDVDEANILYQNNGDGTFTELNHPTIQDDTANSTVGTWGDYDNDGDLDLFVANNIGYPNFLYRNEGSGSITKILGTDLVTTVGYAHGSTWVDYNNDGFLDMFTAEFFATRFNNLYVNNQDGTFTKETTSTIVLDAASSISGLWADYDNDGDQDLFVANTNDENNFLYRNEGNGNFIKITSGIVVTDGGKSVGGSWGDYDNDGDMDLFVANSGDQDNFLYRNEGAGNFTKITSGDIVSDGGHSHGSGWADVNNDGWLDLFVSNDQNSINFLYLNNKNGTFTKVDHRLTQFSTAGGNSFGSAWADYDLDGDLDLFIANHGDQSNVLVANNARASANTNFIHIDLTGTNSNASGIGARIAVKATIDGTPTWQIREVNSQSGGGIGGQSDIKAHFGLGDATIIDSIVVTWPSGFEQIETNIAINQTCYNITETFGSLVSGTVYFDENKNCIQDNNEVGLPDIKIVVQPGNRQVTTDDNGFYSINLNIGEYTLQQFTGGNWSQNCPALNASHTVDVTEIGSAYPNNDFADTASCLLPDLGVSLSPTALRVGFESVYAITYQNSGTQPANNVVLSVDFGPHIEPINASLDWTSNSGTVYNWTLGTVPINTIITIFVADSIKTTATIGNDLTVTATITADENDCNGTDNSVTDINEAVGAIDPNDITAYPDGYIRYDQEITYRIRFQNVGNDLVKRVIVRNELPTNLDLSTLQRGQVSHPHIFHIENERTLIWDFDNINLIDSTTNEPESHGVIWYKIKPVEGLESGVEIPNTAAIFFDASDPVITNTSLNVISGNSTIGELAVWPNPASDVVNLKLEDLDFGSTETIQTIHLYTARGRLIHVEDNINDIQTELALPPALPSGYYVLVAISDQGNQFVGKVAKE